MPNFDTTFAFTPGKLTVVLDGGAGSSGKGKLGSFLCVHAQNWQFACNTFMPQAGHWVRLDDGRAFMYQTLNSCAYLADRYEKLYIGPGAAIEPELLFIELEKNNVPPGKLGISPLTAVVQDIDKG
jgi:adenylosuccinate synthase